MLEAGLPGEVMEYPEAVNIVGRLYDLEAGEKPPEWVGEGQLGAVSYQNTRMWILDAVSDVTQYDTLWHECLHAIADTLDVTLTEPDVNRLTVGIVAALRNNEILREPPGCEVEIEVVMPRKRRKRRSR